MQPKTSERKTSLYRSNLSSLFWSVITLYSQIYCARQKIREFFVNTLQMGIGRYIHTHIHTYTHTNTYIHTIIITYIHACILTNSSYIPQTEQHEPEGQMLFHLGNVTNLLDVTPSNPLPHPLPPLPILLRVI